MEQDRTTSFQIGRKIVCENLEIFLREGKYFLTRETENRLQMCTRHKSGAAEAGEVARNQALKISRLFHEKIKTMVEIKL